MPAKREPAELEQPAPAAPRLTLSELVRLLLAALAKVGGEHSSVEISDDSKDKKHLRVAVRTGEPGIDTTEQALGLALELYTRGRAELDALYGTDA